MGGGEREMPINTGLGEKKITVGNVDKCSLPHLNECTEGRVHVRFQRVCSDLVKLAGLLYC